MKLHKIENKLLLNNEPVIALNWDDHFLHIKSHMNLLKNNKNNKSLIKECLNHIQEHISLYQKETK